MGKVLITEIREATLTIWRLIGIVIGIIIKNKRNLKNENYEYIR